MSEIRIASYTERQPQRPGQISFGIRRMSGEIIWMSCDQDCNIYDVITYLAQYHFNNVITDKWLLNSIALMIGLEDGPLDGMLYLMELKEKLEKNDFMFHVLIDI